MRLDHVSYVTSHDQIADTVQRLGSRISSTFVDGGIHPRFGTRNFTCALKNGQYIEVVCPLDHPATEHTPWGQAVSKKANEGGGWFSWVFSTEDLTPIEAKFGRAATEGHRTLPNGTDLKWKQVGVKEIADTREFPFFIQWLTVDHPSQGGTPSTELTKIVIASRNQLEESLFKGEIISALGDFKIEWVNPTLYDNLTGIVSVQVLVNGELINLE
jgi:hypothetical protein